MTPRRSRTVRAEDLSNIAMTTGGEKKHRYVIDGSFIKEWVGIGWTVVRRATSADRKLYPTVVR